MSIIDMALRITMNDFSTYHRMEPSITAQSDEENDPLTSIAISLKRIADRLDGITPARRNESERSKMVDALTRRQKFSPATIQELVSAYFDGEAS